ncbi:MAG: ATP-binding protein [Acidobacteria bacterium]|nr:ATP-binding protein [Acidobacteriota bacterium]MXW37656.1 ATP-binding protein [Acidobacteriota bacterium]MYA45067.1 ATP-binding protein [Acidobacteriota bacterium]MYI40377.1 ATP-binding protein [Acidobacteriota bacterium]
MIPRKASEEIRAALGRQAVVALLGPRQAGKTTLARAIAERSDAVVLDLESTADRDQLADVPLFVRANQDRLVVLDEIHKMPEIFAELRVLVDEGRRVGKGVGRFLVLGSASIPFLKQSESLAGRIEYVDLGPLSVLEVEPTFEAATRLWVRGGLPLSFLAKSDEDSLIYRRNLVRTYLERDAPEFYPRVPPLTLERLWMMLAHGQGGLLNAARLASGLGISAPTVVSYLDLLAGILLVRRLPPRHANVKKRLVKSPRVYVRDSGLAHALLRVADLNALLGHPVAGPSWEGFVIETILGAAPWGVLPSFYRTATGAEADLVLDPPGNLRPWVIEIKRSSSPRLSSGFAIARRDLNAERAFVVYGGEERFPIQRGVEAISLREMAGLVRDL